MNFLEESPDIEKIANTPNRYLVTLKSQRGTYYVAPVGGMPELENAYYYRGNGHELFFYIEFKSEKLVGDWLYKIRVVEASTERFAGSRPIIPIFELRGVESDIEAYFKIYSPTFYKPYTENHRLVEILFTWDIGK